MESIPHKCCSKCGIDKPLTEFYKATGGKDGYRTDCKSCNRAKTKRWCDKYVDRVREYTRTHKEQNAKHARKYDETHRRQRQIKHRIWYAQNTEKARAASRLWGKRNPEKRAANYNRYRTRLNDNGGSYTHEQFKKLCAYYQYRCLACGKRKRLTADHVIPVSKGGIGDISNIQPLCHSCNASKKDKTTDYRHTEQYTQEELF